MVENFSLKELHIYAFVSSVIFSNGVHINSVQKDTHSHTVQWVLNVQCTRTHIYLYIRHSMSTV